MDRLFQIKAPADEPDPRQERVEGLRGLADWLAARPDAPFHEHVPIYFTYMVMATNDVDGLAILTELAALLDLTVEIGGGHWFAVKKFGPIEYRISYVTQRYFDEYRSRFGLSSAPVVGSPGGAPGATSETSDVEGPAVTDPTAGPIDHHRDEAVA